MRQQVVQLQNFFQRLIPDSYGYAASRLRALQNRENASVSDSEENTIHTLSALENACLILIQGRCLY